MRTQNYQAAIQKALAGLLGVMVVLAALPVKSAYAAVCGADTSLYRSAASGNWAANATWQVSTDGGANWVAAGCWPSSANGAITIRSPHTVTVTAPIAVDQVTINSGGTVLVASGQTLTVANSGGTDLDLSGTLTINQTGADGIVTVAGTMRLNTGGVITADSNDITFQAGSRYVHNQNGGTIPTETWNATSTVEVTGVTTTVPGGLGQTFGNFTWNSTGQTTDVSLAAALTTVNGNLTIASTGGGASELRLVNTSTTDQNLSIGGNLNIQGGNLDLFNSADNNSMTVDLGGSFNQTGGTVTSGNTTTPSVINFNGASGQFTQSAGTLTTTNINFNVTNGAILTLNNDLTIATGRTFNVQNGGTLTTGTNVISGAGTFTLSSGGTLEIGSAVGITAAGATGNIQTTTRNFNTGANYIYSGAVAQDTGTGLPNNLAGDLIINNPGNTVTLNSARTIANNGLVNLVAGTFAAGTNLTMATTSSITRSEGSLTGTPQGGGAYDVTYTGNSKTTGTELAGAGLRNVTVSLTAGLTLILDTNRAPDSNLTVTSGIFDLDAFTINRSAAGGTFSLAAGTTLLIGGATNFPASYNTVTLNATSTVNYDMAGAQTVSARTYGNLTISGSGTKTLGAAASVANGGALNINGATFASGGFLTMNSTSSIALNDGSMTGNLVGGGAYDVTYTGNSTTTGTELSGGGLRNVTVNLAAGQTLTLNANRTPDGSLAVNSGILDLATFTLNRSAGGGVFSLAAGTTLLVGGATNFPANYTAVTLNGTSTVNYDMAGVQTVSARTYGNLTISGSGAKSMIAGTSVSGNLSIAPTGTAKASVGNLLNLTVNSLTLGGVGTVSGTWGSTGSTATNKNDTYFDSATSGRLTVTVDTRSTQATLTAVATPSTVVYGSTSALSSTGGSGTGAVTFSAGASTGCSVVGNTLSVINASGTCSITATKAADSNYNSTTSAAITVTLTKAPLSVTANADSKTYDSLAYSGGNGVTYSSFVNGETPAVLGGTLTYGGASQGAANAGTYAITPGGLTSNNYAITFNDGTLTINKANATISVSGYTGVYDGAAHGASGTATGVLSESLSGLNLGASFTNVPGGTANWTFTDVTGNYNDASGTAAINITAKSITVTADAQTKVYGDADPALTYGFSPALITGDAFTGALDRAAGEDVGLYAIGQGSLALSTNYTLNFVGANLSITAKPITVTADAQTKVYGDADPALTYGFSPALVTGDSFTGTLSRVAGEDVGAYTIGQGTLALSTNYTLNFVGANLTITAKSITVTADAQTKVYGDADPALTYGFSPALVTGDSFTGTLSRAAGEDVGLYAIGQGSLALSTNYTLNYTGANLTIIAKSITVTVDAQTKVYGDADPALTYGFSPALTTGDAFAGTLSRAAGEDVGAYAIGQGSLALSGNYALNFVSADLTITAKAITVTADAQTKVYGEADPALTYGFTPSLITGDAFTGTLSRAAGEDIGTYAIGQGSLALSTNYTLNFISADLSITAKSITVTADAQTKVYGDADPALTYGFAPALVTGDSFTGALDRAVGEDIGLYAIGQGSLALSTNYTLNFVGANLTITAKSITVTADAQTKVYGDADPALIYGFAPALVTGDSFTGTLSRVAGEDVGAYTIGQGTLALSTNYTLNYTGANLTITAKPITVTVDAQTKVYGDADPALTYGFTPALVTGDSFTGSLTRASGEDVGLYAIGQGTLALSTNYSLNFVGANLTITTKSITVTADAQTKVYGDADPALTYGFAPALVTGDSFTGALNRTVGEDIGLYAIGQGSLALSTNYALNFISANLSITAKPITVTADAQTKVYGDADPALTYGFAPALVAGDAFTGTLSRAAGENVGLYAIGQGTLALSTNYTLNYTSANLTITAKSITVAVNAGQGKVFGTADPILTFTSSDPAVIFSGVLSRTVGESVGTYAIGQGTLAVVGGNYTITAFVPANFAITSKGITVTADSGQTKIYGEADPVLTYTSSDPAAPFTGALTRAAGEDMGAYAIQLGTLSAGSDYAITLIPANFTITAKPITVTADAQTKVYGDADPALTYGFTPSLITGDAFAGTLSRAAGEDVGTYAIGQGTLALSTNYALNFISADLSITAKPITITADAQTKVYGDADPALTYGFAPALVTGDSFTGALDRAVGEDIGVYAIGQGTLALSGNYALNFVSANLSITAKTITVTADAQTKVYGDADPALTYGFAPALVAGDAFTGILDRAVGEDVGAYAIGQGSLALSTNYALNFISADLSITAKPITVTADAQTKVYGDADPALTYGFSPALITGDAFAGTLSRAAGEDVGLYAIGQGSLALSTNYTLNFVGANLSITAKSITATADAQTKVYGDADPTLTYGFAPALVAGDAFTGTLSRAAGEDIGLYAIGQGTLALSTNYSLNFIGADLSITAKSITVTADAQTKVYGEADPALTFGFAPALVIGDSFTGTLDRVAGEDVGTYAIGQGTLALSGNYALNFVGANLTITAKSITVTAASDSKAYDGTASSSVVPTIIGGLATGDSANFTQAFADANVGTGKTLIPSGSVNDGNGGNNYAVSFVNNTTGIITPLALTGHITASDKIYDATTAATITGRSLTGVIAPDAVTLTGGTAAFANKTVGAGKTVTATGLSLSGLEAGNYTVNSTVTTTADIAPLTIVGTITAANKVFDGTTVATIISRTLTGVIAPDAVSYVGGTAAFDNPNVGASKPVTATGLSLSGPDAPNYAVNTVATTTADITPAPVLADLSISKTDHQLTTLSGSPITYTIVVTNAGPSAVAGATLLDAVPASVLNVVWTCSATNGSNCQASGAGNAISTTLDLVSGGVATYQVLGTLAPTLQGVLTNTASVTLPSGITDLVMGDNSATDTTVVVLIPVTGLRRLFLPLVMLGNATPATPDVVSSFSLTPNQLSFAAGEPVTITVVITNVGTAPASNFWVDFYINPTTPPTAANQVWDVACGRPLEQCYGIAWHILGTLNPGQSLTLTSTPDSYVAANTIWLGYFPSGTSDLYVYVDSYSDDGSPNGAVLEGNETNNRMEWHGLTVSGPELAAPFDHPTQLPAR